ncbi:MAG: energy-coupling factor ABC transporter permease [Treponema sp.]|nr:energy-coupling factor ABC transporter permease [Treponema sp.]
MHMADSLLSPAVAIAMCAASAAAVAFSVAKVKKDDLCEKKIPVIGVMGAFVFAAQMINFTIPGTGSSGHIGGGILLAAMLGGFPSLLSLSAVLVIQCLFFADGGLLALGCNIFNLGVIPCLIAYPLVYKPLVKNGLTSGRISAASVAAVVAALQLGAFAVVLQTTLSGITELPFATFLALMQPIHLAIGIIEGIVTAGVLCFVHTMRPEIMESSFSGTAIQSGVPLRKMLALLAVVTLITGGGLSLFVSSHPDGLEWSIKKTTGTAEIEITNPIIESASSIQEKVAVMPGYGFRDASANAGEEGAGTGTSLAGIAGGAITFILAGISVLIISLVKKRQKDRPAVAA